MQIKLKLLPWLFVGLSLCLPAWAIPSPASGINYAITAVATDNSGNTTTSSVANVNVGTVVRITYLHNDFSGSPIAATDSTGAILWKENYRPFGDKRNNQAGGLNNRQWFHGKPVDDDTGLSYFGARYYDATLGRFMGVDPVTFQDGNYHSFNRYAYGNNNPYKYMDPDGKFGVPGALIGVTVEIGVQLYMDGKVSNWTAVGVSGAVGFVTGGLGGIIGETAASGSISVARAVLAAGTVGGAAGAIGKVAEGAMTGKSATSSEIAVAGLAGAAGGAAGAKIGLSVLDKVNKLAAKSGVAGHIGATTRDAMQLGGKIAEPATSMGQKTGQRAADTTSSYAEKKINE